MIKYWITKITDDYIEVEFKQFKDDWCAEIRKKFIREKHWPLLQEGIYMVYEKKNNLFRPIIKLWTKKELDEAHKEAERLMKPGGLWTEDN